MKRIAAVFCAFAVLAGCRGSTGTYPLEPQTAGAIKSARSDSSATVHFNFTVPRARQSARRARYVSPNTQSMTVVVNGGTPQPIGLTPATDPNCSGTTPPIVCTNLSVIAPVGGDTFTFNIYKEALVSGQEPPNPTLLATYTTPVPITIVEGASNQLGNFVLDGVPATATLTPGTLVAPADGRVHEFDLAVTVRDRSGATIVAPGTFASPVALHVGNDPHHALSVTPQTISAPSTTGTTYVKVTYDASKELVSGIISVALGSALPLTYVNPLVYKLDFDAPLVIGFKRKITVSEARYAGAFTVTVRGGVSATCKPSSCTPASAGGAITVEVVGNAAGSADVSIADVNGVSATVPFTVIPELEFRYTGAEQIFVVPSGVTSVAVYAYGAQGGAVKNVSGGRGGRTAARIAVTPGEPLGIYVGGRGRDASDCKGGTGGFNGGGNGGDADAYPRCNGNRLGGGGGGGASDVRRFKEKAYDVLVIAGGGGGASGAAGGAGGGRDANAGTGNQWCTGGGGGSSTAGGKAGTCSIDILKPGADGTRGTGGSGGAGDSSAGAGGGGGYYGGGGTPGTAKNHPPGGAGGGSSFAQSTTTIYYSVGVRLDDGLITIGW